jgi:DNA (cytosine-5)-methyltransferase 1
LSELDLRVAESVPPGGNWKNVPVTIPLKRLQTIRDSYARGEGSRSTYYGRLHPDRPSYTINTYFTRPGNGCHLHYDYVGGQHRTLTYREAARLQSFPDSFTFSGAKGDWAKQIGNAVPPLLGYAIASNIMAKGQFVDLFSGAGGLALGFGWAGWTPIIANDFEERFLDTYATNVHNRTVVGDIGSAETQESITRAVKSTRKQRGQVRAVLGGPPCQGFSTAGKRRSMDDARNHLFRDYLTILDAVEPDLFVFENVTGLLNMERGDVYRLIVTELRERCDVLEEWVLHTHQHGIPQRRSRVILVGHRSGIEVHKPETVTEMDGKAATLEFFRPAISVSQALGDLPPLGQGMDGTGMDYVSSPQHPYQEFCRGTASPSDYFQTLRR